MLNIKKLLVKILEMFVPVSATYTNGQMTVSELRIAKAGNLVSMNFLGSYSQTGTGWHTLFTITNTSARPSGVVYGQGLTNAGNVCMLRCTSAGVVSMYQYQSTAPSDVRGTMTWPTA